MARFIIFGVLVVGAVVVAVILQRRKPAAPTQPVWAVPTQLDRNDFDGGDKPWLVAVFTSATCESCAGVTAKAEVLESPQVAYQEISYQTSKDLHERYHIEVVPCLLVADDQGVVRASFIGVPSATDLWAAVAEAREPGSSPEPNLGH